MNKVKYLLTYRYAEIIHDLTVEFTRKYVLGSLSNLGGSRPDYRTADQMNQAARSGKQNIIEGVGQSKTSQKGLIKLFGNPQDDANFLLTLCHLEAYLLSRQIKAAEEKFIKEGGYTETLFRKRIEFWKNS